MEFREQIIEYRKEAPSVASLATKTDLYFLEKYGSGGPGGSLKFTGTMIPGNVYFFNYDTDTQLSQKVQYINRNPLILYISAEKIGKDTIIKSIDLTVTPPDQRLEILQYFWDKFQPTVETNQKRVSKGEIPEEIRLTSKDLPLLFKDTGYSASFTGFKFQFMKNLKWVDYSDWCKLPFLKYTFVQGIPINEIYTNYRSKLKQ
jgi:hypothetical protein